MIVLGGLGTVHGVFFGAVLIGVLETGISIAKDTLPSSISGLPGIEPFIFGAILISVIAFEPTGIYGRWVIRDFRVIKDFMVIRDSMVIRDFNVSRDFRVVRDFM